MIKRMGERWMDALASQRMLCSDITELCNISLFYSVKPASLQIGQRNCLEVAKHVLQTFPQLASSAALSSFNMIIFIADYEEIEN